MTVWSLWEPDLAADAGQHLRLRLLAAMGGGKVSSWLMTAPGNVTGA